MKPKLNRTEPAIDRCQTPGYALGPLLPFIKREWVIWECALGEGILGAEIAKTNRVVGSDILMMHDFLTTDCGQKYDAIITNPPFSIKYKWIERCYELGKPFALLLPLETLGAAKAQTQFERGGIEIILFNRRVNFKMPNKGWDSSAQFPVAWFTHGFDTGTPLTYGKI